MCRRRACRSTFTRRFADGVISRNVDGPLGFGWAVPWFATLSISANDDVLIIHNSGGGQRRFTRDGRGTGRNYFSDVGDTSSMKPRLGGHLPTRR